MQVKNITEGVIRFQVESEMSTAAMPLFKTIQIGAGATAEIAERDWDLIKDQETSVEIFEIEEEPMKGVTMKDADGKSYSPVKRRAFGTGEFKTYNLVEEMVKQRQIELVKEESVEDSREKYAKAAKLMGIKVSDKMSLEDIKDAIEAVRAIL